MSENELEGVETDENVIKFLHKQRSSISGKVLFLLYVEEEFFVRNMPPSDRLRVTLGDFAVDDTLHFKLAGIIRSDEEQTQEMMRAIQLFSEDDFSDENVILAVFFPDVVKRISVISLKTNSVLKSKQLDIPRNFHQLTITQ